VDDEATTTKVNQDRHRNMALSRASVMDCWTQHEGERDFGGQSVVRARGASKQRKGTRHEAGGRAQRADVLHMHVSRRTMQAWGADIRKRQMVGLASGASVRPTTSTS
jgi:hypothetical protein